VARQLKVFNVDVIAANSAGKAREDDGVSWVVCLKDITRMY
jgi:hypothetical protein